MSGVAVIHHAGAFAPWNVEERRPLTTGTDRAAARDALSRLGVDDPDAMLETAAAHGSSLTREGARGVTASEALEGNAAGAFGEEVPVEEIFRHLLVHRRAL